MKSLTLLIVALTLSACASAPATAGRHIEGMQSSKREIVCTGGAIALTVLTRPWGLKDCVSGVEN